MQSGNKRSRADMFAATIGAPVDDAQGSLIGLLLGVDSSAERVLSQQPAPVQAPMSALAATTSVPLPVPLRVPRAPNLATFACVRCGGHFITQLNLEKHLEKAHNVPIGSDDATEALATAAAAAAAAASGDSATARDAASSVVATSEATVITHSTAPVESVFESTGSLPGHYVCASPGCGSMFTQAGDAKRHFSTVHLGIKKHRCAVCDSAFTRTATLVRHLDTAHAGARPFVCTEDGCKQSFAKQTQLVAHSKAAHATAVRAASVPVASATPAFIAALAATEGADAQPTEATR